MTSQAKSKRQNLNRDVEAIIQIEILALSYQLKCFDSGSRKALRQQLRDITRAWVIPREGWQLKSKAYVDSLFEVLYNRTYTLEKNRVEKCDSFSDEEIQGLLIANEQCYILDEAFKSDPDKKAALPYIRKADQLSPAYSDIGSSVDPPCESMEVDDHFSSSITTPDVQSYHVFQATTTKYNSATTESISTRKSHHRIIDQSPYKALFGSDPKVGLSSSALPKELLDTIETEEDLIALTTATSDDNVRTYIETETDLDTNTETETIFDTNTDTETIFDTNTDTETIFDTNTDTETILDTNTETETIFDTNTDTETIFDTNTDTETIFDTNTETETIFDTNTDTETIFDTNTDTETIFDTNTDTETIFDTNTETETIFDTNTDTETIFDTNTDTETIFDTNTETETIFDTNTDTETIFDTNTDTETDLEINTEMETDMDTNTQTDTNLDSNTEINVLTSTSTETDVDTDTNFKIIRARKRALSGQQIQADEMLSSSKKRLKDLEIGDDVIIPVQRVDRGPMDCKNIKGVVLDIAENGYKVGTKVGIMFGFMSRNQIEKIQRKELTILDIT
ncbi:clumping factor A-like [Mytilus trossulus]|uniref:clumping factor A-like n=1 Tax=Mytilus trossulus TaxID=6551 RepID=UPI003004A6F7